MSQERENELTDAERERHQALLTRLDHFANLMDSRFQVPGTRLRFGLDGLIGLIPVVGDATAAVLGVYMLSEAVRIGAPGSIVRRIGGNILLDFLLGLVPVAGDALDFVFKANERNVALLRRYAQDRLAPPEPTAKRRSRLVWVMAALGLVLLTLVIIAI